MQDIYFWLSRQGCSTLAKFSTSVMCVGRHSHTDNLPRVPNLSVENCLFKVSNIALTFVVVVWYCAGMKITVDTSDTMAASILALLERQINCNEIYVEAVLYDYIRYIWCGDPFCETGIRLTGSTMSYHKIPVIKVKKKHQNVDVVRMGDLE